MGTFTDVEGEVYFVLYHHTWKCPIGCQGCDCPCHGAAAVEAYRRKRAKRTR